MSGKYLSGLNAAQLEAVQHPPDVPLQILAGPGSGKTKVLTSRIAHLITVHGVPAESICAVTFTNKAANEMRERLEKLVGKHVTGQIKMGTFHAICAMFLRKYATLVGVGTNFTVCDTDESKKIVTKLLKPFSGYLEERNVVLKEAAILSRISKAKAKGLTPKDFEDASTEAKAKFSTSNTRNMDGIEPSQVIANVVTQVYRQYQLQLKQNNSLDFDDLLVYGVKLFRDHKKVGRWCRHVLVDEFQDTNTMQYQLTTYIARAKKCLSVVGDPDQSIYGWRSAEVENLARMQKDFPSTRQIFLEQNYRSTAAILATSVAIISQDKSRIQKTLHTSHDNGPWPVLRCFPSEQAEAQSIAAEVKRMIAYSGGMLSYSDFVILLRMNSLSRAVESALQLEGIPHVVLGGHRFFERMEIKDLIAYLQVVDNPQFVPAFVRIINTPSRTIGEKTVTEILARTEKLGISPLDVVEQIYDGKIPDIKPPIKRKISSFVEAIRVVKKMAIEGESPGVLVQQIVELTNYQDHLRKHHEDWETRWENVEELINFASESEYNPLPSVSTVSLTSSEKDQIEHGTEDNQIESTEEDDALFSGQAATAIQSESTPLRAFLQASMLSTNTETGKDDPSLKDVTIATCHAAKGLEWPVVFIPAVEKGVFPSSRAEDIEEERRLLYVACTRAQGLLYLSHCTSRMAAGTTKKSSLSEFLSALSQSEQKLFQPYMSELTRRERRILATVLNRPDPGNEAVEKCVDEHRVKTQFKSSDCSFSNPGATTELLYPSKPSSKLSREFPNESVPSPSQHFVGFTSAKNSMLPAYFKDSSTPQTTPLGPSRPGVNAPRPPPIAPASTSVRTSKPYDTTQRTILSYAQPRTGKLSSGNQPTRDHVFDEQARSTPDVSVDDGGNYQPANSRFRKPQSDTIRKQGTDVPPSAGSALGRSNASALASEPSTLPPPSVPKFAVGSSVQTPGNMQSGTLGCSVASTKIAGSKRRLGMRGSFASYSNKKFKSPLS